MDRLRTLSIFCAVAEDAGFAAAARRLNLSPPTVTRAISTLENRLGARLVHRTTRAVSLTDAGQRYYADSKRILAELEDADRQAAGLHAAPRGEVSITASVLFGRKIVAPALFEMLDLYPDISVTTMFVDRVVNMVDEGLDIAVRIAELPDSSLTAVKVGAVRQLLCAAPEYLDKHGRPEHPDQLPDHDILLFTGSSLAVDWSLERDGKKFAVPVSSRLRTNTGDVTIAGAIAGRGIARVLSYQVADELANGRLEIVLANYIPPPVPVHVLHRETGRVSARIRAVVDHLVSRLRATEILRQAG
ncbi:MAG: LysR family transcriptional regulator [Pseudomonadota bacterium]